MNHLTRSEILLIAVFTFCPLLLFADNVATVSAERTINVDASSLASNAGPSVRSLTMAARTLHELSLRALAPHFASWPSTREQARTARAQWEVYLRLPTYPGEGDLRRKAEQDWKVLDADAFTDSLAVAVLAEHLRDDLYAIIDLNIQHADRLGAEIQAAHVRIVRLGLTADVLAGIAMISAASLAVRRVLRARRSLERENVVVSHRADELEAFSGRMAHDVLSPLQSQLLAWQQLERRHPGDPDVALQAHRSKAAILQTKALVEGLLRFALAGARPEQGAATDVVPLLWGVVEGLRAEADAANVTLSLAAETPAVAACSPGVLTSLVLNLARNALKYMGQSPRRSVVIREMRSSLGVRIQVDDTGPGISGDLLPRIFHPYIRGPDTGQPGVGLGLATVQRLVEAHRGRVGVQSSVGAGATFWFELPSLDQPSLATQMPARPLGEKLLD